MEQNKFTPKRKGIPWKEPPFQTKKPSFRRAFFDSLRAAPLGGPPFLRPFGRIYLFAAPGFPALSRPRILGIEDGKNTPTIQEKILKNAAMARMPRNRPNPVPRTFRKSIGITSWQ